MDMESFALTPIAVIGIALASVIVPLRGKRLGILPFGPSDLERISGPRTKRTVASVVFLLLILCLGIYGAFDQNNPRRHWLAFIGSFAILLLVTVIFPEGRGRKLLLKLLEFYLVALTLLILAASISNLLTAVIEGRAHLPNRLGVSRLLKNG